MSKAKPKLAAEAAPEFDPQAEIARLSDRVAELERKQKIIIDGYEFVANEVRPLFGLSGIALIFDAISRKLR